MSNQVEKFQENFRSVVDNTAYLLDDAKFKQDHGFSFAEYVTKGKRCGYKINKLANHIEKVAYDTGIARTTGGGLGIASGAMAIGGILAAPFTAGASLALTIGGVATGVASGATTLTASVIKEQHLKADAEAIKTLINDLKWMDDIVNAEFAKLKSSIEKVRNSYESSEVQSILKDVSKGAWQAYKGTMAYKSYQSAKFAKNVADFIQADFYAMKGVAVGMASPGTPIIFGKVLVTAGSTTAKVLSGACAVFGIGFGIWEVVGGVEDINGSEHAKAYHEAATNILKNMQDYDEFERTMKNKVWFTIRSKHSGLVLDIAGSKHGANIVTFRKHGGDNQIWKWQGNNLVSKLGYVLDVNARGSEEGTKVIAWKHHGGVNQQWIMIGDKIISVLNGMCLDIPARSKSSDVGIVLWSLHSDDAVDHQSWELVYE